jgi:uncharacterized protein (TIGR00251 family)
VLGEHGKALKVALAASPVDGAANAELLQALANWLGVPQRRVVLRSGETGRLKRIQIQGCSLQAVQTALEEQARR